MINRIIQVFSAMPLYKLVTNIVSMFALWVLICAVVFNFFLSSRSGKVKKEKRSLIATGAMFLFFFAMCVLALVPFGKIPEGSLDVLISMMGTVIIVLSVTFNIIGRFYLRLNWGNQIRIYTDHTLVTRGPYIIVRHPLYASTIWMLIGFGLLEGDWLIILCTVMLFLPMMRYRAGLEEKELTAAFGEDYKAYQEKTGMFFPKFFSRKAK